MLTPPGQIAYFGDSLSDDGNLFGYALKLIDPVALEGRVGPTGAATDGPTHATITASLMGIPVQNFSVAAAEVKNVQDLNSVLQGYGLMDDLIAPPDDPLLDLDINLTGQVDRFLAANAGQDLSDTTVFLQIGANDYNEVDLDSEQVFRDLSDMRDVVIDGIIAETERLAEAGVGKILIVNLPAGEFLPGATQVDPIFVTVGNVIFSIHNRVLTRAVDKLADAGLPVEMMDLRQITSALTDDPRSFGFVAPWDARVTDPEVLARYDPDQVFAWDDLHPTTAAHGVIAAFNALVFSGATATGLSERFDIFRGDNGVDVVTGLGGADIIAGGGGDDVVLGGSGNDRINGQSGDDLLSGGSGDDHLRGSFGDDILGGGEGDDMLLGGDGADLLIDGLGSDVALGGEGNDTFIYIESALIGGSGPDEDRFNGDTGRDRLIVVLGPDSHAALAAELEGDAPTAALASLGITIEGIETVIAVEGRAGLDAFASEPWHQDADIWGLI